jgi:hypothetical protein
MRFPFREVLPTVFRCFGRGAMVLYLKKVAGRTAIVPLRTFSAVLTVFWSALSLGVLPASAIAKVRPPQILTPKVPPPQILL